MQVTDWNMITAISSALSVIVAMIAVIITLYQINQNKKPNRKLEISKSVTFFYEDGYVLCTLTLDNIGNRQIAICKSGFLCQYHGKSVINDTYDKYLMNFKYPTIVKVGDTVLIEYKYVIGKTFTDEDIKNDRVCKTFVSGNFAVRDSRNKMYYVK